MTTNEVVEQKIFTPAEMIMAAISDKSDLDKIEKLLEIQMKWEQNESRKVYAKSFAIAQEGIMAVIKTKTNAQTKSKYADLGSVIESAKPVYTKEGFSVTFNEADSPKEEHIRIVAEVLHNSGHKESYHFDVPMDGKGIQGNANMTKIHGKASSVSYARRYLMCMIFNIPTADDDGNAQSLPTITNAQLHTLRDLLISKELSEKKLIEYLKIEALENLLASEYTKALTAINSAKKEVKQ
jgi:hypothetical protein